ncbi:anthranilate phosphoribosyltransferase [Ningiella sp. W23]|uniref:anthranilate phosphoribosyltransferase n=1 Tax=Ningiella sp. W23 TaxID=3023715 RepID=UPI003757F023
MTQLSHSQNHSNSDATALEALEQLYQRETLSFQQTRALFNDIMQGKLNDTLLTAVLVALKMKGEHIDEIAGAASAMVNNAKPFPHITYPLSDIVGTGGDGHNTINVSSAAAIVAACCGIKVAKHGNRSVSSKSGSSDLFAGFGMDLMMTPQSAKRCLDEANLCFLAAPNYHAGVAHAMPVRTCLKTRTLFNILGPLANPAQPQNGVYGVYTPTLLGIYAEVLQKLGHQNALVVHGDGLDEIALHGTTEVRHINNGKIQSMQFEAADFGATPANIDAIKGGEPAQNVEFTKAALSGTGKAAHVDAIAMNAAALLWVNQAQRSLSDCFDQAKAVMSSGEALNTIEHAASISQKGA